jgi:hypothetical protein
MIAPLPEEQRALECLEQGRGEKTIEILDEVIREHPERATWITDLLRSAQRPGMVGRYRPYEKAALQLDEMPPPYAALYPPPPLPAFPSAYAITETTTAEQNAQVSQKPVSIPFTSCGFLARQVGKLRKRRPTT